MKNIFTKFFRPKRMATTGKYSPEVEQIHHEFENASDVLVAEANRIITEASKTPIEKAERLVALGFGKAKQVEESAQAVKQISFSKEQLDLVERYRVQYPLNKFIIEEQVKAICHKYNLVCGDNARYIGFVPEKNLADTERFLSTYPDLVNQYEFREYSSTNPKPYTELVCVNILSQFVKQHEESGYYCYKGLQYERQPNQLPYGAWMCQDGEKRDGRLFKVAGLQICAPVKDMDITGLELEEGYKLKRKAIPDPVVLQPVDGGYLIVTAWGDEASDPIVVHEICN